MKLRLSHRGQSPFVLSLLACLLASAPAIQGQTRSAAETSLAVTTRNDASYVLQQGDEITIRAFGFEELNETVKVGPDGKISAVLLSETEAAGLTVEQLRLKLAARYAQFFREPHVSVIVRTFANHRIYVGGEVERPGLITLTGQVTALGAVLDAGGFKRTAKIGDVILIRNENKQGPLVTKLNLKDVITKGAMDVVLQPFDVIYVPESKIARLDRFIDEHIRRILPIPVAITAGFTYILGNNSSIIRFQ